MGGYQSDSSGGSITFLRNKGFLSISENVPFPVGVKNDVYIMDGAGAVGASFPVDNGDILLCLKDNPGGNAHGDSWLVLPRAADFVEEGGD